MTRLLNALVERVRLASTSKCAAVFLVAVGILALATVARCGNAENAAEVPTGWLGKAAPDFALTNLSGKMLRLSDFKSKVVLLDFWATWCPPCRMEIPDLIQLQKQYAGKGFTVLGVALDQAGATAVKPFARRMGINYPVAIGDNQVTAAYGGIEAIPTTFLIGRDGRVLKTFIGVRAKSEFARDIQTALSQTSGASSH